VADAGHHQEELYLLLPSVDELLQRPDFCYILGLPRRNRFDLRRPFGIYLRLPCKLSRLLRVGAFLEGPLNFLRAIQSGYPGDYVLWLTVGTAILGSAYIATVRASGIQDL